MKKNEKARYFVLGMALMLLLTNLVVPAFAENLTKNIKVTFKNIKLYIDGAQVTPKDGSGKVVEPFIYNDTVYLPVRSITNYFGKSVTWDGKTNSVYVADAKSTSKSVKLSSLDYLTSEGVDWDYKEQFRINTGDYLEDCFHTRYTRSAPTRDYLLNGQYTSLKGTLFLSYEDRSTTSVSKLNIWGDGKLLYTSDDIKGGFLPQSFNVDISGVKKLKFGFESNDWTNFGISNVTLTKK